MTATASFVAQMRRRAGPAKVRSVIWQSLFVLGLAVYGLTFHSFCGDCSEHPVLGYLWPAIVLTGAAFWVRYIIRYAKSDNPVDKALSAAGNHGIVAAEVDAQFADASLRGKRVFIGGNWLCYVHKNEAMIRRIDTLIWAYRESIRHKLQGIIPMGTTYQIVAWDRTGRAAVLTLKKEEADAALEMLQAAAPWMLFGYSEMLKESWNNDRDDLIAHVDGRRRLAQSQVINVTSRFQ